MEEAPPEVDAEGNKRVDQGMLGERMLEPEGAGGDQRIGRQNEHGLTELHVED